MKMKQRIWILPIFSLVIIIVFMMGMGIVYYYNKSSMEKFQSINSTYVPLKNSIAEIHGQVIRIQSIFEASAITGDVEIIEDTTELAEEVNLIISKIEQALPDIPGAGELRNLFSKYYQNSISLSGKLLEAPMTSLMKEMNSVKIFREHFDAHLHNLESFLEKEYQKNVSNAQKQMQQLTWIIFLMIFILTAVLTIGSFIIMRNLSQRILVLTSFAEQVQKGDYDNQVNANWNDEFAVVVSAFNKMVESVKISTDKLNRLANYDTLTEVFSRNALIEQLDKEIGSTKRHNYPLSFCMCDIDKFKTVNDTYGHETGDKLLAQFAKCLKTQLRMEDIIGRYGGDEFCVILPHTKASSAQLGLERVRKCIEGQVFYDSKGNEFSVTCSFGISEFHSDIDKTILMRLADEALYDSKNKGRNCVSVKLWESE